MIAEKPKLLCGDCKEVLWYLPANSVDSIVTDPPAGINFMGKEWDGDKGGRDEWIKWLAGILKSCFRLLKPGGHVLAWAIPRTSHWTATAIENAGFEIHDVITHIFSTGFPKSTDISKQIDKAAGAVREKVGERITNKTVYQAIGNKNESGNIDITKPATPEAKKWNGWGTALKPAHENWILARKSISEQNIAANVLKHDTGGINVDGCRIGTEKIKGQERGKAVNTAFQSGGYTPEHEGRFPSNLILSINIGKTSRFFYCAKPSRRERNAGMAGLQKKPGGSTVKGYTKDKAHGLDRNRPVENFHPTVKAIKLMRYLCRLITPPGGIVLDPFMGSGTTGIAALQEGFRFIGIEKDTEYFNIARARITAARSRIT